MIRLILTLLYIPPAFVVTLPAFLVILLISLIDRNAGDKAAFRFVQLVFKGLLFVCGVKVTVIGRERIPADRPVLFIGNHRSAFDIIISLSNLPCRTSYLAKKELGKIPYLNLWMHKLHCVLVDRGNARAAVAVIKDSIHLIEEGISIFIYPEGTRNKGEENQLLPFKPGSFKVAQRTGCPIVLVALNNSRSIFEAQAPRIRGSHVILEFSEPIDPMTVTQGDYKLISAHCSGMLEAMVDQNAKMLQEA